MIYLDDKPSNFYLFFDADSKVENSFILKFIKSFISAKGMNISVITERNMNVFFATYVFLFFIAKSVRALRPLKMFVRCLLTSLEIGDVASLLALDNARET